MKRWGHAVVCFLSVVLLLGISCMALAGTDAPAARTDTASLPRISTEADTASTRIALPTQTDTSARALVPFVVVIGLGVAGGLCTLLQQHPRPKS